MPLLKTSLSLLVLIYMTQIVAQENNFVVKCEGNWKGKMDYYMQGNLIDQVDVTMSIKLINDSSKTWNWFTMYHLPDNEISKMYQLILINDVRGHYIMDEGDGVILDCFVFGNKMYSVFEVENNLLCAVYEIFPDKLVFEIISAKVPETQNKNPSNYSVDVYQRTELIRI